MPANALSLPRLLPNWSRRSRRPAAGWIEIHPDASWLFRLGLSSAQAFLDLPGEVISGHPTRHVMVVQIDGRTCYLKREHCVRWRDRCENWLAAFGWVSKSVREGRMLRELERDQLATPRALAFGEDGAGRAFLLVEEAVGHIELRRLLHLCPASPRLIARRLAQAIAGIHAAGFDHPDLFAKHVLVDPETLAIAILDWQRSGRFRELDWSARERSLATLHATVAEELASPIERMRFLKHYCRDLQTLVSDDENPRLSSLARRIDRQAARLLHRRGPRELRSAARPSSPQRLVWLDGEALCCVPDAVESLEPTAMRDELYAEGPSPRIITLADGKAARLETSRCIWSLSRAWDALRRRPWRSPELRRARLLFHLERHGVAAPRLLAFGQRQRGLARPVESFLLTEDASASLKSLRNVLAELNRAPASKTDRNLRWRLIDALADCLRRLHDAGCTLDSTAANSEALAMRVSAATVQVVVADIDRIRYRKRAAVRHAVDDLRRLWQQWRGAVSRSDLLRFVVHYSRARGVTAAVRQLIEEI